MTKQSKLEKEKQEAYNRIINHFPDYPPMPLQKFEYPMLSAKYELLKDNDYLHRLQHQSWLAGFAEQYFGGAHA